MHNKLIEKLITTSKLNQSRIILNLNPRFTELPLPIQRFDDPFLPFGKAVVNATKDITCGYMLDFASYLALGAAGAVSLERTARYISANRMPCIIHGPFLGTSYSSMCDQTAFGFDGLTLYSRGDLQHYLEHPPYGALVINDGIDTNQSVPIYSPSRHQVRLLGGDLLYLTDNSMLQSARGDDFEIVIREKVEGLRSTYAQ